MIDASGTHAPIRPSIEGHAAWCDVPQHLLAQQSNPVSGAASIGCIGPAIDSGSVTGWLTAPPAGTPVTIALDWLPGSVAGLCELTVAQAGELRCLLGALLLQVGRR